MYARVPQAMAQFVRKIEKLSHIMDPTPILEMARAYGLRPRLWLLNRNNAQPRCNIVARTWPNDHNIMQHPRMFHEKFDHFQI